MMARGWRALLVSLVGFVAPSGVESTGGPVDAVDVGSGSGSGSVSVGLEVCGTGSWCAYALRAEVAGDGFDGDVAESSGRRRYELISAGATVVDDDGLPWVSQDALALEVSSGVVSVRLDVAEPSVTSFQTAYEMRRERQVEPGKEALYETFCALASQMMDPDPCCMSEDGTVMHQFFLFHNETTYAAYATAKTTAAYSLNVSLVSTSRSSSAALSGLVELGAETGAGAGAFFLQGGGQGITVLGSVALSSNGSLTAPGELRVVWDTSGAGESSRGILVPAAFVGPEANALGISPAAYNSSFACGMKPGQVTSVAGGDGYNQLDVFEGEQPYGMPGGCTVNDGLSGDFQTLRGACGARLAVTLTVVATDAEVALDPLYAETAVESARVLRSVEGVSRLSVSATVRNSGGHVGGSVGVSVIGCTLTSAVSGTAPPSGMLDAVSFGDTYAERLLPNATLDVLFNVAASRALWRSDAVQCTLGFTQRGVKQNDWTGRWPLSDVLYDESDMQSGSLEEWPASNRKCTADEAAIFLPGGALACLTADCAAKYGTSEAVFDPRENICVVADAKGTRVAAWTVLDVQCGDHGRWDGRKCLCDPGWSSEGHGEAALAVWAAPHCGDMKGEGEGEGSPSRQGQGEAPMEVPEGASFNTSSDSGDDDSARSALLEELRAQREQVLVGVVAVLGCLALGGIAVFIHSRACPPTEKKEVPENRLASSEKRRRAKDASRSSGQRFPSRYLLDSSSESVPKGEHDGDGNSALGSSDELRVPYPRLSDAASPVEIEP